MRKIQQGFNKLISPSTEGAYPVIDRALGIVPLGVALAISGYEAKNNGDYKPFEKSYSIVGLPIVAAQYAATQFGLTYAKAGVEKIESTTLKGIADFFVGLVDTWNNVPLYVYGYNMLPGKASTNAVIAFKYMPGLVSTIEGDIKTVVNGGKYELTSWSLNTSTAAGFAAKNLANAISDPLKNKADEQKVKETFDSIAVSGMINGGVYKLLTGILNPLNHKEGEFSKIVIKSAVEDVIYETKVLETLVGKLPANLGGVLPYAFGVETFFYLLDQSERLVDHGVGGLKNLCENHPEICDSASGLFTQAGEGSL